MLNYLKHYKKIILFLLLAFLFFSGNYLKFGMLWQLVIIPVTLVVVLFTYEFLLSRENREEIAFWDLKEFKDHQSMPIDALDDLFRDDHAPGTFSLKTKLTGTIKGSNQLHSPLTQTPCYGYKLTVGLLKAKDFLRKQPTYTRLLINELKTTRLSLLQGDDAIPIEGEPLLNLKNHNVQNVSWDGLKKLNEKIVHKIEEALTTQNITRSAYTALSITEEILTPETEYLVYGVCKTKMGKGSGRCVIEGNNIIDNPESLFITSFSAAERQLKLKEMKRRINLRRAIIFPLILLAALPIYYFISPFLSSHGRIYYKKTASAYRIDLERFAGKESYDLFWKFDKSDTEASTQLLGKDNEVIYATRDVEIEISRQLKETRIYTIGKDPLIVWKDVYWSLDFTHGLPEPAPSTATREHQRIYMKNTSKKDLNISFIEQESTVTPDQTWTWEAGHGTDWEYGSYAIYYENNDNEELKKNLLLSSNDIIILKEEDKILRSYLVGYSKEIENIADMGWYLLLDEKSINLKSGKIYVKNPSKADYMIYILDFQGKYQYDDYWEFNAGKAADTENGLSLIYEHDENKKEDILCYEGMQFKIIKTEYQSVWKGKLDACPYAEYKGNKGIWEIFIE